MDGIGQQNPSDSPFMARLRFHQSWYRHHILGVPYEGYGNLLTKNDADKGLNFRPLFYPIVAYHVDRTPKKFKTAIFSDLLSIEAMAFNLLYLLYGDGVVAGLLVEAITRLEKLNLSNLLIVNYQNRNYQTYKTRFDGFIPLAGGNLAECNFIGIILLRSDDQPNNRLKNAYTGVKNLTEHQNRYGYLVVIYHPDDLEAAQAARDYQASLNSNQTNFFVVPLDAVLSQWEVVLVNHYERCKDFSVLIEDSAIDEWFLPRKFWDNWLKEELDWLAYIRQRYLDFTPSQALWEAYQKDDTLNS